MNMNYLNTPFNPMGNSTPLNNFSTPSWSNYYTSNPNLNFSNPTQTQQNKSQNNIIWVNGKENARTMQLQPNSTVILLDNDSNRFYIKSTDEIGLSKIRSFTYTQEIEEPEKRQEQQQQQNSPSSPYITKPELEQIINKLKVEITEKENTHTNNTNTHEQPVILKK